MKFIVFEEVESKYWADQMGHGDGVA